MPRDRCATTVFGVAAVPEHAVPEDHARRRGSPAVVTQSPVSIAPRTLITFILLTAGALALGALVMAVRSVLVQLVVAIVLAMALEPLVKVFERRGVRPGAAVGFPFRLLAVSPLPPSSSPLFPPLPTPHR